MEFFLIVVGLIVIFSIFGGSRSNEPVPSGTRPKKPCYHCDVTGFEMRDVYDHNNVKRTERRACRMCGGAKYL